ncbi:Alpha/Beta hydrolase protein [Blastocladiella britannica]|nr:Alpha/Beta hydrolase protein [Blastocladiella britannica]
MDNNQQPQLSFDLAALLAGVTDLTGFPPSMVPPPPPAVPTAASCAMPQTGSAPTAPSAADFRVLALPDALLPMDVAMYSGHLACDDAGSTLFFMYFERTVNPTDDLILWLNGGPGTSSLFGQFVENGPLRVNAAAMNGGAPALAHNPHSWHHAANLLYLELPAGVGFAHVPGPDMHATRLSQVTGQFWRFAQRWTAIFAPPRQPPMAAPLFDPSLDFWPRPQFKWWLMGESFAGMFIPHIVHGLVDLNAAAPSRNERPLAISGIAIFNGAYFSPVDIPVNWVDYFLSRHWLRDQALRTELVTLRHAASTELAALAACHGPATLPTGPGGAPTPSISGPVPQALPNCTALAARFMDADYIERATQGNHSLPTFHDGSVTARGSPAPTDAARAALTAYLNRADVQFAMHAAILPVEWSWLRRETYERLYWNGDRPSFALLPSIVERGIPVLLAHGDRDVLCNHVGAEQMLSTLEWQGGVGFGVGAGLVPYVPAGAGASGEKIGGIVGRGGLTYIKVRGAGHMVPFHAPAASLNLVKDFLSGRLSSPSSPLPSS